jgi:hypothetical protein
VLCASGFAEASLFALVYRAEAFQAKAGEIPSSLGLRRTKYRDKTPNVRDGRLKISTVYFSKGKSIKRLIVDA